MNKKNINWINKGVLGAAIIAGCSACTDTVADHYDTSTNVTTKTLWEQIKENETLQGFAEILEKTHYYTSETQKSTMTYKDLLSTNSKFTVWAPVDGSYNKDSLLTELENPNNEYDVQQRFIKNHICTFSQNLGGTSIDSLTMLNTKMNLFDNGNATLKGVKLIEKNIGATNGILHTIEGAIPFQDNIYEYISKLDNVSKIRAYFALGDTTYINENLSTMGPVVDGSVLIVDTVWTTESQLFYYSFQKNGNTWYGINANLKDEDSSYAMVIPTDQAWDKAYERIQPLFKYMSTTYANKIDKDADGTKISPDSMQTVQTQMSIVNNLVFSTNTQGRYTIDDFGNTDSLLTTTRRYIYAPVCNNIFDGKQKVTLSNGYAYVVDNFNYTPEESYMPDIEIEGESYGQLYEDGLNTLSTIHGSTVIIKNRRNPNVTGTVSEDSYMYTRPRSASSQTTLAYLIPDVLSGKYDIYAVMLPSNIMVADTSNITETAVPTKFQATLRYYNSATATSETSKTTQTLQNDINKVDTILLWEDFEFPIAYKGVTNAYPTITLVTNPSRSEILNKRFSNAMYLDKIILKTKEE